MILPIYTYGQPVLREKAKDITPDYPNLSELIENMFETMYNAEGIGLAAPQVGLNIRLFIVDLEPLAEDNEMYKGFKKVFINPQIVEQKGEEVSYKEGCLSLPGLSEAVTRPETIVIEYLDENFKSHRETFSHFFARCIQHEYDHIEGILFIDHIAAIRKQLIKSKLNNMIRGKINCGYPIKRSISKR